jgi:hypothetical protein
LIYEQAAFTVKDMKKIILSLVVTAFAVAAQAGGTKSCQAKDTDAGGCCCHHRMQTSEQAEGTCPFAKHACTKQTAAAKKMKKTVKQVVLLSPKAASEIW